LSYAPRGWRSFRKAMPPWLSQKLHRPKILKKEIGWEGKVLLRNTMSPMRPALSSRLLLKRPLLFVLTALANGQQPLGPSGKVIVWNYESRFLFLIQSGCYTLLLHIIPDLKLTPVNIKLWVWRRTVSPNM